MNLHLIGTEINEDHLIKIIHLQKKDIFNFWWKNTIKFTEIPKIFTKKLHIYGIYRPALLVKSSWTNQKLVESLTIIFVCNSIICLDKDLECSLIKKTIVAVLTIGFYQQIVWTELLSVNAVRESLSDTSLSNSIANFRRHRQYSSYQYKNSTTVFLLSYFDWKCLQHSHRIPF